MGETARGPRVLVIGLDGATHRLLAAWQESGLLPHLASLSRRGATGVLRSTVRPESSVAWSSFATGLNPGRHGIFGFSGHVEGTNRTRLMTAADLRAPTFWEHAAVNGVRVGMYNIPVVTYPPRPLPEGSFSVGGLMTPGLHSDFTWPSDLKSELLQQFPGYRLDIDPGQMSDLTLIAELEALTRDNLAASRWLIERYCPELFVGVFMATDRIQHHLWHHLDPGHPRHDPRRSPRIAERILALYRQLDSAVGELSALADPEGLVMVLSDHGFNGCHRSVSLNTWLAQNSGSYREPWLAVRPDFEQRKQRASRWAALRRLPGLRRLKAKLPGLRGVSFQGAWRLEADDWAEWSRTRAYFSSVGGIRINCQGRDPHGIVTQDDYERVRSEIASGLLALRDPQSGVQPIAAVHRREELYQGLYVELAPDLITEPRRDAGSAADNYLLAPGAPQPGSPFAVPEGLTGNHDLDGILIAAGPNVTPGPLSGAHLWDMAPTICQALDIPVPAGSDGEVLAAIIPAIAFGFRAAPPANRAAGAEPYDPDDERDVTARLRDLGYLE